MSREDLPPDEEVCLLPIATPDQDLVVLAVGLQLLWLDHIDANHVCVCAEVSAGPDLRVRFDRSPHTHVLERSRHHGCAWVLEATLLPQSAGLTLRTWLWFVAGDDPTEVVCREHTARTFEALLPELAAIAALVVAHVRGETASFAAPDFAAVFGTADPAAAVALAKARGLDRLIAYHGHADHDLDGMNALLELVALDATCTHVPALGRHILQRLYDASDLDPVVARSLAYDAAVWFADPPHEWQRLIDAFDLRTEEGARVLVDRVFCRVAVAGKVALADLIAAAAVVRGIVGPDERSDILAQVEIPALGLAAGVAIYFPGEPETEGLWVFETAADLRCWRARFDASDDELDALPAEDRVCRLDWREGWQHPWLRNALTEASGLQFARTIPLPTRGCPDGAWASRRDVAILHAVVQALAALLPEHREELIAKAGAPRRWDVRTVGAGEVVEVGLTVRVVGLAEK